MNIKELFNRKTRDKRWSKNGESYKKFFRQNLALLKFQDENPDLFFDMEYLEKVFYRLNLGYLGVGKTNGITSGLISRDASVKGSKTTPDHVFGMMEVGRYVHQALKDCNYDIDWMVDTWLFDNLYLWCTIKVTRQEHQKDNIIQNQHTIQEKNELQHYTQFSGLNS